MNRYPAYQRMDSDVTAWAACRCRCVRNHPHHLPVCMDTDPAQPARAFDKSDPCPACATAISQEPAP